VKRWIGQFRGLADPICRYGLHQRSAESYAAKREASPGSWQQSVAAGGGAEYHEKKLWLFIVMTGAACSMFGCAAMTVVPQGSLLIGVYKGTFNGVHNEGSVEIKLYQKKGKPL
jgi:hypothetical protein